MWFLLNLFDIFSINLYATVIEKIALIANYSQISFNTIPTKYFLLLNMGMLVISYFLLQFI